jgi:3-hydroxymyristoyl/3-hydroxydecanoyl-(acyl carrier protein) dehydratase
MWYELIDIESSEDREIRANIQVPAESPWFDGHFPGEPVLPGLAQISMVFDIIQQASEGQWSVSSVSRVRFKRIVRPEDRLEVIAAPLKKEADGFSFSIQNKKELVCSGLMQIKAKSNSG